MHVRSAISSWLWWRTLVRHRSRMGRRAAPHYTRYANRARAAYARIPAPTSPITRHAEEFRAQGYTWFRTPKTEDLARTMLRRLNAERLSIGDDRVWTPDSRYALGDIYQRFPEVGALFRGETGDLLRVALGSEFRIFFGILYRSVHDPNGPSGSQRWHSDAGPGTCTNLMFCLTDVRPQNGAMEILPWPDSLELFRREAHARARGDIVKSELQEFYEREISADFTDRVAQPSAGPGLVFPFLNNAVHRGGFPEPGKERIVCVFHVYPSIEPASFDTYRERGIGKTGPFPNDPDWQ